ncbi:MAG: DM13 domain-containing protein [Pseudomonadota bacterium]
MTTANHRPRADRIAETAMPRRRALRLLALGGVGALAACTVPTSSQRAATAPEPAAPTAGARTTARGSFVGASNHVTTGHARVVFDAGRVLIELEDDFTFDGAPDPKVALGQNGFDASTIMGPLRSNTGRQVYELPAGADIGAYNEVWIWCERFNVPLGVAALALT